MATSNLGITEVAASQNQKEVTINEGFEQIDNATNASLGIAITGNRTLTADEYTNNFVFDLTGSPGAGFDFETPATSRFFFVQNNTGQIATVQVTGGGGVSIELNDGAERLFYCDGTDIFNAGGGATASYDIPMSFASGVPTSDEIIGALVVAREVDFEADFANSEGYIGTNPTASFVISVQDDGTEIGTVTISTGGVFTFATTGNTAKTVAKGSRLEFVAPNTVDATAEYILITLAGVEG